jgi:hypothetical protein
MWSLFTFTIRNVTSLPRCEYITNQCLPDEASFSGRHIWMYKQREESSNYISPPLLNKLIEFTTFNHARKPSEMDSKTAPEFKPTGDIGVDHAC